MSFRLAMPHGDLVDRPAIVRTRSHSTPARSPSPPVHDIDVEPESNPEPNPDAALEARSTSKSLNQHSHARSKSDVHHGQAPPTEASTDPSRHLDRGEKEKQPRLPLSGKQIPHAHLRERVETKIHGTNTYSEADGRQRLRRIHGHEKTDSLPNLVAGLRKEGERRANADADRYGHGQDTLPSRMSSKMSAKMGSSRAVPTSRDPATGESKSPMVPGVSGQVGPQKVEKKSVIEEELERADRLRRQRRFTTTAADVAKKDKEIEEAETEMRERLDDVNSKGMDMTRWLDYAYYNLLEKLGHVVDTIHSFQSLTQQSKQVIAHFDHESERLDDEMTRKIARFTKAFGEREARLRRLETKGKELGTKAEELGRRLEQARAAVEDWEKKEDKSKQVWSRFWSSVLWLSVVVLLIVFVATAWKELGFLDDPVKAGLGLPPSGRHNTTLGLGLGDNGGLRLTGAQLPDEVRTILEDIDSRNRKQKGYMAKPVLATDDSGETTDSSEDDARLHVLDEL